MKSFTLLAILSLTAGLLAAQSGSLDLTFNDSGKVLNYGFGMVHASAIQDDGKILVGGEIFTDTLHAFTIVRYNSDGTLDASFGDKGKVLTSFNVNDLSDIYSLAITKKGNILASGYGYVFTDDNAKAAPLLVQYLPDGNLDPSFGESGKVAVNTGKLFNAPFYARAMQIMDDGSIIQAGDNGASETLLAKYNADGSLNKSFGTNGIAHIRLTELDHITSLALQSDGKMIVGGEYSYPSSDANFLIARIDKNGILDSSFGINGKRNIDFFGNADGINALALQPDGNILAAGSADTDGITTPVMTLVRFKPDGFFDSSFGKNGVAFAQFSKMYSGANGMVLQNNGNIDVAGFARTFPNAATGKLLFALAQFNSDGSANASFGTNGTTTTDFGYYQQATSVSLQKDGKIITAGLAIPGGDIEPYYNLALARYNNDDKTQNKPIALIKKWIEHHILHWQNMQASAGINAYSIQQSSNGINGFSEIAKVFSSNKNIYTYSLPATTGSANATTNYYRINAINSTGNIVASTSVISDVIAASTAISIYPNPASNILHIKGLDAGTKYEVQITNAKGNVLSSSTIKNAADYNLNVQTLYKGVYYANITSADNNTTALKFLKD